MKTWIVRNSFVRLFYVFVIFIFALNASGQSSLNKALDQDGDNKSDFLLFRRSENRWYAQRSDGTYTYTQFGITTTDWFTPGDYDGDGKGDISVWRPTDGNFYYIESSTGTAKVFHFGMSGDKPVARKWDSDNITDFAVARKSGGRLFWYIYSSLTSSVTVRQFGLTDDYAIPGDYDGDGIFDLAVQREATTDPDIATFYIRRSTDGVMETFNWQRATDFIVLGDYDGDGKTDICTLRGINGDMHWFVRKSSTLQLQHYQWGRSSTDLISQGDYDGDGTTDIAVWRATDGTFYVRKSSDGGVLTARWGISGDSPIASYNVH